MTPYIYVVCRKELKIVTSHQMMKTRIMIMTTLVCQERTEAVPGRLQEAPINVVALGEAQKAAHQRDSWT